MPEEDTTKSLRLDPGVRMKVAARKVPLTGFSKAAQEKYAEKLTGKLIAQRKDGQVKNDQGRGAAVETATDRSFNIREDKDSLGKYSTVKTATEGCVGEGASRKASGTSGDDRNDGSACKDRNGLLSDEKQVGLFCLLRLSFVRLTCLSLQCPFSSLVLRKVSHAAQRQWYGSRPMCSYLFQSEVLTFIPMKELAVCGGQNEVCPLNPARLCKILVRLL